MNIRRELGLLNISIGTGIEMEGAKVSMDLDEVPEAAEGRQ